MAANNIRSLRRQRGLTLDQMAERVSAAGLEIDPSLLSRLERGQRRLDADRIRIIAAALGVPTDDIVAPGDIR